MPIRLFLFRCTHTLDEVGMSKNNTHFNFRNVGVHVTFDVNHPPPIHSSTKDTLRVSCRSLSCLEDLVCHDSETWVKVIFRRQVYSSSSTGLEKFVQGVYNNEDIHTKITHGITQRSHDPGII